ncbi:MAG TPA: FAD-dependent monooxygenase, partial [Saprospiraceae bacterium]|nr:FAD-dependent monooxygenase [Saprospiraceae bacterium]
ENKFFVADTVLSWQLGYDGLVISPADRNFVGFFPMKGKSNYRVLGTLPNEYFEKKDITFNDIEKVIIETLGIDVTFEKVNWLSIYNLHHRRVDEFRAGNAFVAGDAAHIHSPAGGQGMNTGLQDAYNIAWKLAFVIKGYAKNELLDTYNEERLPFAKWLMSFTDRGFNILTSDRWFLAFLRKHFASKMVGIITELKWFRPRAFKILSQIGYSYHGMSLSGSSTAQKLKFKSGDRLPYVVDEISSKSIYHLFTKPSFSLLHIGKEQLDIGMWNKIKSSFPFPVELVEDKIENWSKNGVKKDLYILVRPDNYILYLSDSLDALLIKEHLSRYFL